MSLPVLEAPSLSPALELPVLSLPSVRVKAPAAYPRAWVVVLLLVDLLMFVLSNYLAAIIGFRHWSHASATDRLLIVDGLSVIMWLIIFERLGLYRRTTALSAKDELYYTVAALSMGVAPQLLLFTIMPGISTSRMVMLLALGISILTVGSTRAALHAIRKRVMRHRRRIAVVGDPERCAQTLEALDLSEESSTLVIPISEAELAGQNGYAGHGSVLGEIGWFQQACDWNCDTLLLTEMVPPRLMPQLLEATARGQIRFAFAPPRIRCHSYGLSLQTDGQQALIIPSQLRSCTPRARLAKRLFDLFFGSLALLIFSPIMLASAIAVYVESGGPILFRQRRVGFDGEQFDIFKFRSMRKDAEASTGPVWARPDDSRKTRVGAVLRRLSLDELPQLFNVLRGEMSLVGPRPERPVFVENFRRLLPRYDERHLVRPGITGWSQIHMKRLLQTSDAGEKLSYDLHYVEQWSLFLDLSVLLQTAAEFLFHRAG